MLKKLLGFVAVLSLFAVAGVASAATITAPLFSNGDTTIDVTGGSTVSGTFILQVGPNEVCEVLRTHADTQAFTDTSVGGNLGYQQGTHVNVPFNVKVSPNTGTYNATVQCAGIWGGNRSVDGADNVVVGPQSLGTIRVVASGTTTGGGTTGGTTETAPAWLTALLAQIQALIASINAGNTGGTPVSFCTQLDTYSDLGYGDRGTNVRALQRLLIKNGYSIPAGATSFYGVQTTAAHADAMADCD